MKQLILVMCLVLVGCSAEKTKTSITPSNELEVKGTSNTYHISEFEYDGCQYIAASSYNRVTITHKGNCKHCEKRANR